MSGRGDIPQEAMDKLSLFDVMEQKAETFFTYNCSSISLPSSEGLGQALADELFTQALGVVLEESIEDSHDIDPDFSPEGMADPIQATLESWESDGLISQNELA